MIRMHLFWIHLFIFAIANILNQHKIDGGKIEQIGEMLGKGVKKVVETVVLKGAGDIVAIKDAHGNLSATSIKANFGSSASVLLKTESADEIRMPVGMILNGHPIDWMELWVNGSGILERELSGEELEQMELTIREGRNSVVLRLEKGGDLVELECKMFLWYWRDRLVVTDIDGTITKSDVCGMVLEEGCLRTGIRQLFAEIRGYKFVYLSARPSAMGHVTRGFLANAGLPEGALLLSSAQVFRAVNTAIRRPHLTKIKTMQDLEHKFNPHGHGRQQLHVVNPFVVGLGNQATDLKAYAKLHFSRIFIVQKKGNVEMYTPEQQLKKNGKLTIRYVLRNWHLSYLKMARELRRWIP